MSHTPEPSNSTPPVVKDKNPHNYRKVGYSLIVISVSLVLIGLLVLEIGGNYHFSGDIMAKQEITAMTPKHGYTIVAFDYTQPVGAKIQLLGAASNFADAVQLRNQYMPNYNGQKGQVLIFDTSTVNNTNSVSLAEVYAMTPTSGYNIVSFNTMMPVGARLSPQTLDPSLGAATNDSARYATANADPQVRILTFTSSFDDNLKQILGSSYTPTLESENINQITSTPPKLIPPPPPAPVIQNTTSIASPVNATVVNATVKMTTSTSVVAPVNATVNSTGKMTINTSTSTGNSTKSNMTAETKADTISMTANATATGSSNHTMTISNTTSNNAKTISLSENLKINTVTK
ncbi:hypothetical protein [Candidatus Nitrosotalea okcheonensis]|uniref:Uncharacterized protein n=1 Tax=Candidatus Nitrosotalea okcheonensis TaxID=1903276 RepID=A0A2H1FE53_9ARCH|nr:hypothetical protein [Candidatus Nitrosotalea okcheonensis]SMH70939.1 protein of unknown function [Candidatus Nitrosotalea okcheonensis]